MIVTVVRTAVLVRDTRAPGAWVIVRTLSRARVPCGQARPDHHPLGSHMSHAPWPEGVLVSWSWVCASKREAV